MPALGASEIDLESGGRRSSTGGSDGGGSDLEERVCRICHMGLESSRFENGIAIELGCACKDDMGTVHKRCAETWFKVKGNRTCEICHSSARNVTGPDVTALTQQTNPINGTNTARPEVWAAADNQEQETLCWRTIWTVILTFLITALLMSCFFRYE